jgi:PAS domain S-box-containing protein
MKSPLHVLHLEDNPNDARLIKSALADGGIACAITRVDNRDDFVAALERGGTDLVISDFTLPTFDGLSAVGIVLARWPKVPVILVSGTLGEERAVDALKGGATDYILKGHLTRLMPAVRRAMQEVSERAELKQAEAALIKLGTMVESSDDAIIGKDLDGIITSWNRGAEKIFGYAAREMVGQSVMRIIPADRQDEENQFLAKIKRGETVQQFDTIRQAKDGRRLNISITVSPVKDAMGSIIGVAKVARDVTERNQLEAQIIEVQKMEVVGQLASGVAHDFNNILGVIMGYSDLLMEKIGPDSPLCKLVKEIRHASDRAAGLTRQLLVFSRKQTVQPVVLDLNVVVQDMDKMLRRLIGEHIEISMVTEAQIGHVLADAGYVGQVLMNLVINARDAMPKGGKLAIATRNVTLDENYAHTHKNVRPGNYVMLSVSDTGTGMTDEVKARIFEAFFTTKPAGKGTGLGLATCQTIAEQCAGHISCSSELGQGTTFRVYFPQVDEPLDVETTFIKAGPAPRGTETVLVVEDDPAVRKLVCGILEAQGYKVLPAANGQEALRVAQEHKGSPLCLVVTDVIMPLMGGKAMAEWLRTAYPDLKILFTSGYLDDTIANHGVLKTGMAFLAKPYSPATLVRTVRELLDNKTDTIHLRHPSGW